MKFAILLLCCALCACATPYGEYGMAGGYRDSRIDANTFSISVQANGFTSQQTAANHGLYRAAELTAKHGFDYFVIVGGSSATSAALVAMPGVSTSSTVSSGSRATTTTTSAPVVFAPMAFPESSLVVKTFRGAKPSDTANAYDAREVMEYLGPAIGAK